MDGLPGARAQITGLRLKTGVPGLELLGYQPPGRAAPRTPANAAVTDWVTLLVPGLKGGMPLGPGRASTRRDPDGHIMLLVDHD